MLGHLCQSYDLNKSSLLYNQLRYDGGAGGGYTANARESKLVRNPVHVEGKVGVDTESVGLGTAISPAGDTDDTF